MKLFKQIVQLSLISEIQFLYRWESQILVRDGWKSRVKTGKTIIFPGIAGEILPIFPWKDRSPIFTCS